MKAVDPGHTYELDSLDDPEGRPLLIRFVKREGGKYPGNAGAQPGPIIQEYLRALIDRVYYLQTQEPAWENTAIVKALRAALWLLEHRAFRRHGDRLPLWLPAIERAETCRICGHIGGHRWGHDDSQRHALLGIRGTR